MFSLQRKGEKSGKVTNLRFLLTIEFCPPGQGVMFRRTNSMQVFFWCFWDSAERRMFCSAIGRKSIIIAQRFQFQ